MAAGQQSRRLSRRITPITILLAAAVVLFLYHFFVNDFGIFPEAWDLGLREPLDEFKKWVIVANRDGHWMFAFFFQPIKGSVDFFIRRAEDLLFWLPWPVIIAFVFVLANKIGKLPLAIVVSFSLFAMGLLGLWDESMQTLALMVTAVILSILIGIPLGIWTARSDRAEQIFRPVLDAMQTMPAFVYLIPVVLFFGIARVPSVISAIIYAIPPTVRAYEFDWSRFAGWYSEINQEPFALERLAAMDVQDYITWGQQQGLKATTLNRRLVWLKQYATWGEQQGVVKPEMRKRIKAIPIQRKQQLAPRSLSPQEARKLLKEVKVRGNPRDEAIISILLYTGLRVGELVTLKMEDVTLSERKGVIQVRAEVAKGGKERAVPVPKKAREALKVYMEKRSSKSNGPLFIGRQGPLSTEGVAAVVAKYAAWSRLEGVTPHILRHTFAYSYLENNNNDLVALADILGHSDLNTTRIYTKRRLSDLQEGAERVQFF